jgi:hypothetical protein
LTNPEHAGRQIHHHLRIDDVERRNAPFETFLFIGRAGVLLKSDPAIVVFGGVLFAKGSWVLKDRWSIIGAFVKQDNIHFRRSNCHTRLVKNSSIK